MTREQLYTTVSRGRTANHLYIAIGDSEPHRILLTDTQEPTATDILQRVLSRTSLPVSATTVRVRHERAAAAAAGGRVRARALSPGRKVAMSQQCSIELVPVVTTPSSSSPVMDGSRRPRPDQLG
jgi:hypothetical protein